MTGRPGWTIERLTSSFHNMLWGQGSAAGRWWRTWPMDVVRVGFAVGRDLTEGQLTLRAMSLVYTTLLSLVPLLAISFSVLKGFGVHNQIEPLLLNLLAPLGPQGVEISERIIGFVENVKVGILGSVGFALLFYTVVSLMQKIERAFNYIWHVVHDRTLMQRVRDYLSVIVIGPVLVFSSIGITASLMSARIVETVSAIPPLGYLIDTISGLVPYLMIVAAFSFIYSFVPHTRVRIRSAIVGGIIAGLLWHLSGWAFASFVAGSTKYAAIYSTFATLILFMIWLYLGWLILLIGASIAFYDQNPESLRVSRGGLRLSIRTRERLALSVAYLICESHYRGRPALTAHALGQRLQAPPHAIDWVVDAMLANRILARTDSEPATYIPACPLETTEVGVVLDAVRTADETGPTDRSRPPTERAVDDLVADVEKAVAGALRGRTLKDLALSESDTGDVQSLSGHPRHG